MNARPIYWISAALNLALAGGVVWSLRNPPAARRETQSVPSPALLPPAAPISTHAPAPQAATAAPPQPVHWNRIASADLKKYRDNLLALGCPRLTVHDVILGEINERFDERRRGLFAALQNRFWDVAIRGEAVVRNELGGPVAALALERQQTIDDVLGNDYGLAEAALQSSRETMQRHLQWLPAEKRDRLFALEQTRQQRLAEWAKSVGLRADGQLTAEDTARLQSLQKEFEDARKELLTTEELEESLLRTSKESLWAIGLAGFEVTESEWRTVTRLRADFADAQRALDGQEVNDEDRARRREELQAKLTSDLSVALGAERFSQYELAGDGEFQDLYRVTQRYGLKQDVAVQANQVRQTAVERAEQVRADQSLSAETRQAALTAIRQETERMLAGTLGEKVLATYKEYGGDWLEELSR